MVTNAVKDVLHFGACFFLHPPLTLSGTGQGIFCPNKNKGLCWISFFQLIFFQKIPNSFGGEN